MTSPTRLVLDFDGVLAPYGPDPDLRASTDGQLLYAPRVVAALNQLVRRFDPMVAWLTTREDDVHALATSIGVDFTAPALELVDGSDEAEIKIATLAAWLRDHPQFLTVWVDDAITHEDLPHTNPWRRVELLSPGSGSGLSEVNLMHIEMILAGAAA